MMKNHVFILVTFMVLIFKNCQQAHGQSSCVAAGYSSCCVSSCSVSGGCYCDFHCHTAGDCCPDINLTCPTGGNTTQQTTTEDTTTTEHRSLTTTQMTTESHTTTTSPFIEYTTTENQQLTTPPATTESYATPTSLFINDTSTESGSPTTELHDNITITITNSQQFDGINFTQQLPTKEFGVMQTREIVAWALMATFALLFIGLLTVNITAVCIYKWIHTIHSDDPNNMTAYEMEGNPCYEAVKVEQTTRDQGENIYEGIVL